MSLHNTSEKKGNAIESTRNVALARVRNLRVKVYLQLVLRRFSL